MAHNAVERLAVKGQDVLVTGCGPVGIFAQSVAKALGAKRCVRSCLTVAIVYSLFL